MGMPKRLFQEMRQQPSEKVLHLDARRCRPLAVVEALGLRNKWMPGALGKQPVAHLPPNPVLGRLSRA